MLCRLNMIDREIAFDCLFDVGVPIGLSRPADDPLRLRTVDRVGPDRAVAESAAVGGSSPHRFHPRGERWNFRSTGG
ncbi:hypothetical protein NP88_7379 [Burkholderia cepacia]|nr:hypothetical protein NP88_7379 [Burkholderia cepacia]